MFIVAGNKEGGQGHHRSWCKKPPPHNTVRVKKNFLLTHIFALQPWKIIGLCYNFSYKRKKKKLLSWTLKTGKMRVLKIDVRSIYDSKLWSDIGKLIWFMVSFTSTAIEILTIFQSISAFLHTYATWFELPSNISIMGNIFVILSFPVGLSVRPCECGLRPFHRSPRRRWKNVGQLGPGFRHAEDMERNA